MLLPQPPSPSPFFFFNDTATTEIYTLSLHDALPILFTACPELCPSPCPGAPSMIGSCHATLGSDIDCIPQASDRKSTRLNSSHQIISYAVFCLKKKTRRPDM